MSHDDFAIEPIPGLPERPPLGETVLWQGRPDWWALSREALSLPWVAGYFAALAAFRVGTTIDQAPIGDVIAMASSFLMLGLIVAALLIVVGIVQARATVYTITNRRVAMRIGAALTVTLNLPFSQIRSADLDLRRGGTGTIAFDLMGETRLSYLVCWPHVRPWALRRTQPALRCIPDAATVARLIAEQAGDVLRAPRVAATTGHPAPIAAE